MAYPNRNYGSGRGRSEKRGFNDRGFNRPTMHKTICSNCGKECEVPFRPTGEKPVYCRDCFREMGGGDARRSEERSERNVPRPQDNRNAGNVQYDQQFAALNAKVDKILSILTAAITPEEEEKVITPIEEAPKKKKSTAKKTL